jgi:hypothetical protein
MSIDNDKILPDERTRHWMMAQSHIHIRDGAEDDLDQYARIRHAVDPEGEKTSYEYATAVDKARAKTAFESINDMITKKDLNSDNLFEDLISEKAFELDRVSHFHFFNQTSFYSLLTVNKKVRKMRSLNQHSKKLKTFKEMILNLLKMIKR